MTSRRYVQFIELTSNITNTPIHSSAAVERLFSVGSDILIPKRSSLTADNFERLIFIKGNLHLLSTKKWLSSLSSVEEDEENL
jgi:hypothetical protein